VISTCWIVPTSGEEWPWANPVKRLSRQWKRENIVLVVMDTHGRRGLEHTLFGTVAKYVVMHSKAPVLIVNPYRVEGEE